MFKTMYDRDPTPGMVCTLETVTETEWQAGCDVANILRHYMETSDWNLLQLPPRRDPILDEVEVQDLDNNDLHTQLLNLERADAVIKDVKRRFNSLDAETRARYNNNYLAYANDYAGELLQKKPEVPESLKQAEGASKSESGDGSAGAGTNKEKDNSGQQ